MLLEVNLAEPIRPFARALYLCETVIGYEDGKVDLYNIFDAIRPTEYPYSLQHFCVFAQLAGGLGDVPCFVDIVFRPRNELIRTTETRPLQFPTREVVKKLVLKIQTSPFQQPGDYLFHL